MQQILSFEAFPDRTLAVFRIQGLQNGGELRDALVSKSLGVDAAFIDAATVPDLFLLHLAAFKALVAQVRIYSSLAPAVCTEHLSVLCCSAASPPLKGELAPEP
jgi:hypothetical protein